MEPMDQIKQLREAGLTESEKVVFALLQLAGVLETGIAQLADHVNGVEVGVDNIHEVLSEAMPECSGDPTRRFVNVSGEVNTYSQD